MKKLVIANSGKSHQGKTTSIKKVLEQLRAKYPCHIIRQDRHDIKATIQIGDVLIGIESQGDPISNLLQSIDDFVAMGCQIIIAACRTYGDTYNKIVELNTVHQYELIWASHDKSPNPAYHNTLNDRYAQRVIGLIMDHIHGQLLHTEDTIH